MRLTVACFLITSGLFAADPWTKSQVALELGYQAALLCDWRQTSDYHKTWNTNDPIIETNPLLGSHPKQSTINQWCIPDFFKKVCKTFFREVSQGCLL